MVEKEENRGGWREKKSKVQICDTPHVTATQSRILYPTTMKLAPLSRLHLDPTNTSLYLYSTSPAHEPQSSLWRMVLEEKKEKEPKEVIEHENEVVVVEEAAATVQKRSTLRKGSEGEEVRELQKRC